MDLFTWKMTEGERKQLRQIRLETSRIYCELQYYFQTDDQSTREYYLPRWETQRAFAMDCPGSLQDRYNAGRPADEVLAGVAHSDWLKLETVCSYKRERLPDNYDPSQLFEEGFKAAIMRSIDEWNPDIRVPYARLPTEQERTILISARQKLTMYMVKQRAYEMEDPRRRSEGVVTATRDAEAVRKRICDGTICQYIVERFDKVQYKTLYAIVKTDCELIEQHWRDQGKSGDPLEMLTYAWPLVLSKLPSWNFFISTS